MICCHSWPSIQCHIRLNSWLPQPREYSDEIFFVSPFSSVPPPRPQFRTMSFSLDMTSVPLLDKINLHLKVGEMIYTELRKGALAIIKAEKLLEKEATNIKQDKANPRVFQLQNEGYKELIIKLGVDPGDNDAIENKKNKNSQLKFTLQANKVTIKISTRKSPFELVYGTASLFPSQLAMSMAKLIQDAA